MSLWAVGLIVLCGILLGLAVLVLGRDHRARVNKFFGLLMLTIVGWIATISLALSAHDPTQIVVLARLAFAFATAMPLAILAMLTALPPCGDAGAERRLRVSSLVGGFFIAGSLSPWLVSGARQGSNGTNLLYGPLHSAFGFYVLVTLAFALTTLARKLRRSSGITRLQLRGVLLGILVTSVGVAATNLVIPMIWNTSRYSVIGPYFMLVLASSFAHAIVRHQLMDIRVVIRRSIVYLCAIVVAGAIVLGAAAAVTLITDYDTSAIPLPAALILALVVGILFPSLKGHVNDAFNRYLYRSPYDYRRIVSDATRRLGTMLELDALFRYLADTISATFQPELVAIFLRDRTDSGLTRVLPRAGFQSAGRRIETLSAASPLVASLAADPTPFLVAQTAAASDALTCAAAGQLRDLGGEIAVPLIHDRELTGALVVGPKRAGDPYFSEDLALLTTLAGQAAIAIKNAELYSQVILAHQYIENILATMESGVVAVDASGAVELFNATAERLSGRASYEVRSRSLNMLPAALATALGSTLEDREPRAHVEATLQRPDASAIPIIVSTSALRDGTGTLLGAVAVFNDLTTLKQLEEDKRRVERLASVGALAAGIAHEIKNPLVAIKTFAELLPERYADDEFRNGFSRTAIKEIERIDNLVERLRVLAAPATKRFVPLDLREPIEETLTLLLAHLEQTGISARAAYDSDQPSVIGDHDQLKQLFLNLFVNAVEAMSPGGKLCVRVSRRPSPGGDVLVAEVADTGAGIPEELLPTVFDPFVSTKARGSGLGLSICRGIADAHRAVIRAEANPGGGTIMTVEFPALVAAADW